MRDVGDDGNETTCGILCRYHITACGDAETGDDRKAFHVCLCVCVCVSQTEMTVGVVSYIKPCRQTDGMNGRAAMDEQ